MPRHFLEWIDRRTDYRRLLAPIRRRVLPGGPRWSYTTGSCLLWMLIVEVATGLLLMADYSPSTSSAWASVHYIEQISGGQFIRGLHYFAGQALIVLFGVHTVRVLLAAAFRPPHELIWASGLLLIPLVLVWAITGNPLAGTQKGRGQIEVEGNIIGSTPGVGPVTQRILIGGDEVGNLTLTHLYFLHVALMPLVVGALLVVHISQIYRHGLSTSGGGRGAPRPYWPYQTVRNMTVLAIVLGGVALLAWRYGAPLDAPADPELPHTPRPEWYFLFLFELRRYFTGRWEFVATIGIPSAVLVVLLAMPLIDRVCPKWLSVAVRYVIVIAGVASWSGLTLASLVRDHHDAEYQASREESAALARRARILADSQGIPPDGAIVLLRNDPLTHGPKLFAAHCASCHSYEDPLGRGMTPEKVSAPNLYGFASRTWLSGLLDPKEIVTPAYFGATKHKEGEMVGFITGEEFAKISPADRETIVIALSAQAHLDSQKEADAADAAAIAAGTKLIKNAEHCAMCHRFDGEGELGTAPDLTGYGTREWLAGMIGDPNHERFYKDRNDRMPAFAESDNPANNRLSRQDVQLLADWLRGEWYQPDAASGE